MTFNRAAAVVAGSLLLAVPAYAQGTAPSPGVVPGSAASAPAPTGKPAVPSAERTAKSKDCSMQADKQGLHGKARKKFRNACKHGLS
ncbi:hypothetical protein AFCDBAGC_3098 [Methylobacterium cerastii]|uniref:Phosphate starvation-inducible protein PsiF n=1 Tax=Methylobacterium cerastii TaxID=932741 RepID=A0ABQ4QJ97_9HYPH|nr:MULTISPECIES: phosphate starvation-inducible protein PsiF [Methylobacterium]TXN82386.1 phosphate starvation-inducible protein PsiF [Methylobacterium sp. WL8]GJD45227.1 hypothetical protein AFCDBAGC_3098 [Methylobacterium cerastii]